MYMCNRRAGEVVREAAEMACGKSFRPSSNPQHTFQKQNPNKISLYSWSGLISPPASSMKAGELVTQPAAPAEPSRSPSGRARWGGGAGSESRPELLRSPELCFGRSPVHLSLASSACPHHLQLCQMPCTGCNLCPVPREGGRELHYYIQTRLHHL